MRDRTNDNLGEKSTRRFDGDDDSYRGDDMMDGSSSIREDRFREDVNTDDRPLSGDPLDGGDRLVDDSFAKDSSLGRTGSSELESDDHLPLFSLDDSDRFRGRWKDIQTNFVDEPRRSVEEADELVAEVTERLTSAFTRNRSELERQWTAGDEVSTENLRQTLKQYRSFFERLLSM